MGRIISTISAYLAIGVLLFSISFHLQANASMDGSMDSNSTQGDHMMKGNAMMDNKKMAGSNHVEPPLKQLRHGIPIHDIKCSNEFTLVLKSTNNSPACVKSSSVHALVARGWALSEEIMMKMMNQNMTNNIKNMMENDTMMKNETMMKDNMTALKNNMENKSMGKAMSKNKMPNDSTMTPKSSIDESRYPDAPALVGITDYINTSPANLAQDMKGKVVVYDFWTFNCINCIHTLPHVVDLSNKYMGKGVLVIGIHSPETVFEKDPNNVKDAVHRYNIQYPVVTDNEFQTWNAFGNHYWPHVYVADAQGKIRYDHVGEGAYDEIDNTVASLLLEQEKQNSKELVMG